jgi:CubicO group peptidase (beta-lactamase class C family)
MIPRAHRRLAASLLLAAFAALTACSEPGSDASGTGSSGAGASGTAGGGPGGGGGVEDPDAGPGTTCTDAELAALEATMASVLDAAAEDPAITAEPAFTLLLEAEDGRRFTHSHGDSTATTPYESASTSKWVTAVVILELVDQGLLSLDTTASELLSFWAEPSVDLRDLMSFTSGFADEPFCLNLPGADFTDCVESIYADNSAIAAPPGTEFDYSGTHLQVAGLMAIEASGAASWTALFDAFKGRTGLFTQAVYNLPSAQNPRLAGGMTWTGEEYLAFLRALYTGDLLQPATRTELFANQRGEAVVIGSPVYDAIGEDWSYGLGNWLECPTATEASSYDCGEGHRNSSAGAYGAYPFIDFDHHYFGILARQGALTSAREGIALFRTVEELAGKWAAKSCE